MSKRLLTLGGLALAAGIGLALWLRPDRDPSYFPPLSGRELAEADAKMGRTNAPLPAAAAPLDLSKPVRLAIGGLGLADEQENAQLGDLVTADLSGAPGLQLVERRSLDPVLRELELSLAHFVRARDAVRAGKLLAVDWFLFGTAARLTGTNCLVVRVVDARTGILRDAGILPSDKALPELAADLARFMQQGRQNAATASSRVYLALGPLEDLSVNNRRANFPDQLQSYLTAAYQGGPVTLLERDSVDALLQEVRLDLAGLTESSDGNRPPPMQSAFWLVSGQYQSYETTNLQVEVNLDVQRIFGRARHIALGGLPGDALEAKIKTAIDGVISDTSENPVPNRLSEERTQMFLGKDLVNLSPLMTLILLREPPSYQDLDEQTFARNRRNAEAAIKAFQTVLLLDPGNREAKIYLAHCLRDQTIERFDDAWECYREILEEPVKDQWTEIARDALLWASPSRWSPPGPSLAWYETAAHNSQNPSAAEFFRKAAEYLRKANSPPATGPAARAAADAALFGQLTNSMFTGNLDTSGLEGYLKTYGKDRAAAAARVAELYRGWRAQAPELSDYFLAAVVTAQVDTNAPVVSEFQRMLEKDAAHPETVFRSDRFWQRMWHPVYQWSYDHGRFDLAALMVTGKIKAAPLFPHSIDTTLPDDIKLALAFADMGLKKWGDALDIFESYSNRPVRLNDTGPWGTMFATFLPGPWAAHCREKLGLPAVVSPLQFDLGKPVLCLCSPAAFTTDEGGLWIAIAGQLLHLDFNLKTNLVIDLPMDTYVPVTALAQNASSLWIATAGAGLIEYDKTSRTCRNFTVNDGLMLNLVNCLQLAGNTLWIGYGDHNAANYTIDAPGGGGLGCLNLTTLKFTSFTPSLKDGTAILKDRGDNQVREPLDRPTARAIRALAAAPDGTVWLSTTFEPLRQYRSADNVWQGFPEVRETICFAVGGQRLFTGQNYYWQMDKGTNAAQRMGVTILNLKDGEWHSLQRINEVPPGSVTALAVDGNSLWVGGVGYVARVDLAKDTICKFAQFRVRSVDHIEVAGGSLWVQSDGQLYRAALGQIQ